MSVLRYGVYQITEEECKRCVIFPAFSAMFLDGNDHPRPFVSNYKTDTFC